MACKCCKFVVRTPGFEPNQGLANENMMEKTIHGRQLLPDVLKGVAVLLMIQVHLMELFAKQELYSSLLGRISLFLGGPPAAPVFMAVMGYFLAKSESGTTQLVLRGIRLIIYGFLLNIGLNMHLFYHIFTGELAVNPLPYIFGADILFLAGMSVIIIALLRLAFRNSLVWWLLIMLVAATAGLFIPSVNPGNGWSTYLLTYIYMATWWSYFPLLPWLAYPLAGYCFRMAEINCLTRQIPVSGIFLTGLAMLVLLVLTFSYGFNITADLPAYYHHTLPYFLWAMLFLGLWLIVFWQLLKNTGRNPVIRYLQWTGRNVTIFYVFQWLIIGNLATAFYKSVPAGILILWFAGITTATSLLVVLTGMILKKLRHKGRPGLM